MHRSFVCHYIPVQFRAKMKRKGVELKYLDIVSDNAWICPWYGASLINGRQSDIRCSIDK